MKINVEASRRVRTSPCFLFMREQKLEESNIVTCTDYRLIYSSPDFNIEQDEFMFWFQY